MGRIKIQSGGYIAIPLGGELSLGGGSAPSLLLVGHQRPPWLNVMGLAGCTLRCFARFLCARFPPSFPPSFWLHVLQMILMLSRVSLPPSAWGIMWSACGARGCRWLAPHAIGARHSGQWVTPSRWSLRMAWVRRRFQRAVPVRLAPPVLRRGVGVAIARPPLAVLLGCVEGAGVHLLCGLPVAPRHVCGPPRCCGSVAGGRV